MGRDTKFSDKWLCKVDANKDLVSDWCEKVVTDPFSARCRICFKTFSVASMGFVQIDSHAKGAKHKSAMQQIRGQSFFKPTASTSSDLCAEDSAVASTTAWSSSASTDAVPSVSASTGSSTVQLAMPKKTVHWLPVSMDEKVIKAEALFALKLVSSNYSFASFDTMPETCKLAFPDSEIAQKMTLSSTKVAYTVVHGLAPYVKSEFLKDIRHASVPYFSVYFDETTTKQVKKQLDMHVGYWSDVHGRIVTVYLQSAFLGHAEARTVKTEIVKFLDDNGLQHRNVLHFSMDGPAVNLSFLKLINEQFSKEDDVLPLVNIGTCSLHPVHTAVRKGVESLPFDFDVFVNDLFMWFKLSAARRFDYVDVQRQEELVDAVGQFFMKPVSSRWLSMEPVCRRVLEQYDALKKYFITELPKHAISTTKTRHARLKAAFEDPVTLVYLNFVAYLASCVTPFLLMFQSNQPLVHLLFHKANELVRQCMLTFIKPEVVAEKEGQPLFDVDCEQSQNWMDSGKMAIGSGTNRALKSVPDNKKREIRLAIRSCLKTTTIYLQQHLPITNPILRDFQCLHPAARKEPSGRATVARLCQQLKKVCKTDSYIDKVDAEWLLYMASKDVDAVSSVITADIGSYWNFVSKVMDVTGSVMFPHLSFLAKACLTVSHGNAVAERGFSVNTALLAKDRLSLEETTIQAIRVVKEAIRLYGTPTAVPVTRAMISAVRQAHSQYVSYLEAEKQKTAAEDKRKKEAAQLAEDVINARQKADDLSHKMHDVEQQEREQVSEQDIAQRLINEAASKLSAAVKSNNMQEAKVAQVMLDSGNDKLNEAMKQLVDIRKRKDKIQNKLLNAEKTVTDMKKRSADEQQSGPTPKRLKRS